MENQRHPIIGNHYFAQASAECQLTFSSGCYFACISLCQSVAEAYARFMYEKWTRNPPAETFGANINKLEVNGAKPDVGKLLNDIYGGQERQDFHHLNKTVPTDYEQLRVIANDKIKLLNMVESQIFAYEYGNNGGIVVKYEVYWEKKEGLYNTYIRFE
jgi:hypothetical protein